MSTFETGSFDAVIDKGIPFKNFYMNYEINYLQILMSFRHGLPGTMDSLLVSTLCCNRFINKPYYKVEYFLAVWIQLIAKCY